MGIDRSCPLVMISNKSKPIWESGDLNCSVKTLNIPYNDKNEPDIAILGMSFFDRRYITKNNIGPSKKA